jgi:hypothetical protein
MISPILSIKNFESLLDSSKRKTIFSAILEVSERSTTSPSSTSSHLESIQFTLTTLSRSFETVLCQKNLESLTFTDSSCMTKRGLKKSWMPRMRIKDLGDSSKARKRHPLLKSSREIAKFTKAYNESETIASNSVTFEGLNQSVNNRLHSLFVGLLVFLDFPYRVKRTIPLWPSHRKFHTSMGSIFMDSDIRVNHQVRSRDTTTLTPPPVLSAGMVNGRTSEIRIVSASLFDNDKLRNWASLTLMIDGPGYELH